MFVHWAGALSGPAFLIFYQHGIAADLRLWLLCGRAEGQGVPESGSTVSFQMYVWCVFATKNFWEESMRAYSSGRGQRGMRTLSGKYAQQDDVLVVRA